jgi:hypothetical protein
LSVLLALTACSEEKVELFVDLKTDFVPGVEFTSVQTERFEHLPQVEDRASQGDARVRHVGGGDFVGRGIRIAELRGLEPGVHHLRIRLLDARERAVVQRLATITLRESSVFTVVVTRDCRGVTCPLDDLALTECLGARCVDPRCTAETPEYCGSPACAEAADCAGGSVCTAASCEAGACLSIPAEDACQPNEWCDPEVGCTLLTEGVSDWGEYAARLPVRSCDGERTLVVDTTADERDGGLGITDAAEAGSTLSLVEALRIASNADGPVTIRFDPAVFPVDAPGTIAVGAEALGGAAGLTVRDTCLDARARGVVVTWSPGASSSAAIWRLQAGSLQIGLTLLRLPWELVVEGAQVAGCRIGTDGETVFPNGEPEVFEGGDALLGPGNAVAGAATIDMGVPTGPIRVEWSYFGQDPLTREQLGGQFIVDQLISPRDVVLVGNVFVAVQVWLHTPGGREVHFRQNRFGVDERGAVVGFDGLMVTSFMVTPPVTLGPNNLVQGSTSAAIQSAGAHITENSIFGNAAAIASPIAAPTISAASTTEVRGTCPGVGVVEVFSDAADQGETFLGRAACDGAGFVFTGPVPSGRNVTATFTDETPSTSGFSAPMAVP